MYKGVPSLVWVMLFGLIGIELLVLIGIAGELRTRPLPAGELAIFGLLFVIIGLIIWGAAWLISSYRKRYSSPLVDSYDTDYPVRTGS